MAINASRLFIDHHEEQRLSEDECREMCELAHYVNSVEESKSLNRRKEPMVVISASGMATGGRVLHHLKAFAPDPKNLILFAGFQAAGTRGEAMLAGVKEIKIHGELVPVRAEVLNVPNLSAHADYTEILDWLKGFEAPPRRTFITHGEPNAAAALEAHIGETLGWSCHQPAYLEQVGLERRKAER
jgi:metallo-beta-lactamase family protein